MRLTYKYKGNIYKVTGPGKFKHPETREWVEAIVYTNAMSMTFMREEKDFFKRFKEVNDDIDNTHDAEGR